FPLHAEPYEPAARLPQGKKDPAFRTKPQIGMALVEAALALGLPFRAVVADCTYGESAAFEGVLREAGLPYVLALKPSKDRGAAGGEHLVSGHEPAPTGLPAGGRRGDRPGGVGRGGAAVWAAQLGGAELQASETRVGLGGFPGAGGLGDPAALGVGLLRLLF